MVESIAESSSFSPKWPFVERRQSHSHHKINLSFVPAVCEINAHINYSTL